MGKWKSEVTCQDHTAISGRAGIRTQNFCYDHHALSSLSSDGRGEKRASKYFISLPEEDYLGGHGRSPGPDPICYHSQPEDDLLAPLSSGAALVWGGGGVSPLKL